MLRHIFLHHHFFETSSRRRGAWGFLCVIVVDDSERKASGVDFRFRKAGMYSQCNTEHHTLCVQAPTYK